MKTIMLLLLLIILSGCSVGSNDYNEFIYNENYYNKNIDIKGKVMIYQDGFYYIVDKNNIKIKLIECSDKYNLILGEYIEINGYLLKEGNKISFACKSYTNSIQNLTSEVDVLNQQISQKKQEKIKIGQELERIKISKQNQVDSLNSQISTKKSELNELTFKISDATKQKEISDVQNEILDVAKYFPDTPKIEDFQKWIVRDKEPYKTEVIGRKEFRDMFYKISAVNKNYSITVYADRNLGSDYYKSYSVIVERLDEKYTCTKSN